jgi:hypothetical protein
LFGEEPRAAGLLIQQNPIDSPVVSPGNNRWGNISTQGYFNSRRVSIRMATPTKRELKYHNSSVGQWLAQSLSTEGIRVRSQLRGNDLHVLCEALGEALGTDSDREIPDRHSLMSQMIDILYETDIERLISSDQPPLHRIKLYGSVAGYNRPSWTEQIELNHLDRARRRLAEIAQSFQVFDELKANRQPIAVVPDLTSELDPLLVLQAEAKPEAYVHAPTAVAVNSTVNGAENSTETDAIARSNRNLAKRGDVMAIAAHLSETLSEYGVAVQVSIKTLTYTPTSTIYGVQTNAPDTQTSKRLWIACQAEYSPEPSMISEPIAHKLRDLEIEGFRDAVILFQVTGETQPDWKLRVNLTPAQEMLKEWARWGDVEAIQRLLNHELAVLDLEISHASLNESTLHLTCVPSDAPFASDPQHSAIVAQQKMAKAEISLLLEALGPQGIRAAAVYGQFPQRETPVWVEWFDLPAAVHSQLADAPIALAQQRDWGAIAFLLHRLLNPDLDQYLATGGIRIQLLPKRERLHLMCEAARCPDQREIVSALTTFFDQAEIPLAGVRIYGRRAGQKHQEWNHNHDLNPERAIALSGFGSESGSESSLEVAAASTAIESPDSPPDFAATDAYVIDAYVEELVAQPESEPIFVPNLTTEDIRGAWQKLQERTFEGVRQLLVRSHLFNDLAQSKQANQHSAQGFGAGLVWSALGVLLMVQINWALTSWVNAAKAQQKPIASAVTNDSSSEASGASGASGIDAKIGSETGSETSSKTIANGGDRALSDPSDLGNSSDLILKQSPGTDPSAFNASSFTEPFPAKGSFVSSAIEPDELGTAGKSGGDLPYTPQDQQTRLATAEILTNATPLPTFNSKQLDEKVQLYYQYLKENGRPDVMIVGSSRALRGVDPIALKQSLSELGYANVKIFNFGINGATVQVVDLLTRQLLKPHQMPRLIVWADGARAFNSGNKDITYDGIVASKAYRQLVAGTLPLPTTPGTLKADKTSAPQGINVTLTESYQSLDRWLSQQVAVFAPVYGERDRLKHLFQQQWAMAFPMGETGVGGGAIAHQASPHSSTGDPSSSDPSFSDPSSSDPSSRNPSSSINTGNADLFTKVRQGEPIVSPDGFLSLGIQFNPATYYQKHARVSGLYDGDYTQFRIDGVQGNALGSFLSYTREQNIPVVFVNLPLTDTYLDVPRQQYEAQFRQYLATVAAKHPGFIFRDFGELWTQEYRYFSDPSHLNRYGAYAVSNRLAQDAIIPWNESTQQANSPQVNASQVNASPGENRL